MYNCVSSIWYGVQGAQCTACLQRVKWCVFNCVSTELYDVNACNTCYEQSHTKVTSLYWNWKWHWANNLDSEWPLFFAFQFQYIILAATLVWDCWYHVMHACRIYIIQLCWNTVEHARFYMHEVCTVPFTWNTVVHVVLCVWLSECSCVQQWFSKCLGIFTDPAKTRKSEMRRGIWILFLPQLYSSDYYGYSYH